MSPFEKTTGVESVFEARDLCYDYPGGIPALRGVSFSVRPGETIALLGANGSGKSTLLKLLDGLVFPSSGGITFSGKALTEKSLEDRKFALEFRRSVGFVFQDADVQLFSPTVWDEVTFGPLQLGVGKAEVISRGDEALRLMNISHLRERPPYLLSGGEKRKVALASVLSMRPQVLLLDEPTSGLDPWGQGNLIDFLIGWAEQGKTLIFSTQDLDVAEGVAQRLIVLGDRHGVVADGNMQEHMSDPDFLLRANLVHEHSHRHKELVHRHQHVHEHEHPHEHHH